MAPRLIAIAGPSRGASFDLTADSQSIGRDSTNWISIPGSSVSRKHCSVNRDGSTYKIIDLKSKNGTSVNGIPIRERALQEGDRIEVGDSVFLFVTTEEEAATAAKSPDEGLSAIPTTRLRIEDALYLEPEKLLTSMPLTTRIARGLDAILKLSRAIQAASGLQDLREQLLRCVFSVTPAARGAVIVVENDTTGPVLLQPVDPEMKPAGAEVGSAVVDMVLRERSAILSNDVVRNPSADSTAASSVASLIAVPMIWMERIRGILYVDTPDPEVRFDEDHLQLVSAVASIGAVSLESVGRWESLRSDQERLIENLRMNHNMVGESPAMQDVYRLIRKVAAVDSTVLICGESGTGKELAAHAIHLNSSRCGKPMVAINCANLSESLLESELFGYEKGAFTGAHAMKKGKLDAADGGTLFLDEISELALPLQARLLRVLQEREFERVGGTRAVRVDIRLIAATNRDLQQAVRDGKFRDDLYYRLNVVQIKLPPLRNRKDDIPLLASYFAATYAQKCGRRIEGISPEAHNCLLDYTWPGNVRELQNCIERAIVLGTESTILPEDLPDEVLETGDVEPTEVQYRVIVRDAKRKMVHDALQQAGGNHNDAAALLGMHPNNLRRLLRNLGIRNPADSSS